jgi:PLP dependent protein
MIKDNIIKYSNEMANKGCALVAVSKTHSVAKILEAYNAGQRIFGENKVQEMVAKHEALLKHDIEWHFIGHLQRNKVKFIAPFVGLIHSADSQRLLEEINKQGEKFKRIIPCLAQMYISNDDTKFGFEQEELLAFLASDNFRELKNIRLEGLMGMATLTDDTAQIRSEFKSLKSFFEQLKSNVLPSNVEMKHLSMGMSSDYQIALEEGSTLVRIGTAIFGTRDIPDTAEA